MKGFRKVIWAEGVFLGQQHFQAWDIYQSHYQKLKTRIYEPHFWGVKELEWNEAALQNSRLELVRCLAVFPDGSLIDYDRKYDKPVSYDLSTLNSESQVLALSFPSNDMADSITGYAPSGSSVGWHAQHVEVPDQYDPSRKRDVLLGQPNMHLHISGEDRANNVSLNVVRVIRSYDNAFELDKNYIPPVLSLDAAPVLSEQLGSVIDILQSQFRSLHEKRVGLGDVGSFLSSDLADFLLQSELTEALAELRVMGDNKAVPAIDFYRLLRRYHDRIALHLAPEKVPFNGTYEHNDLTSSFSTLYQSVRAVLGAERKRAEAGIAIEALSPGRFQSTKISQEAFEKCSFYLSVYIDASDTSWIAQFPAFFKVASPSLIENMVASATPGVQLVHTQRVPQKIRIKSGYEYFLITKSGDVWASICRDQQFSAFAFGEFAHAKVELIAVEE
ncbi:type VI secretion system baseplate subunit TssK [Gynuella sunshinyii]|uniref:Type VI secretion protein, VC_A0114 family n=1 Tax=Gynuella sunshinyii YC6258 TaxID=1445510 RepID=A0A0C5VKB4_9GAMM|nr:type VI secretion system baseplate subunit TssK [Gynuella sunshinyii]AJQ93818.1 hypothetical protein YC6258_01774 [Gynuella sunshinyii YC6258]